MGAPPAAAARRLMVAAGTTLLPAGHGEPWEIGMSGSDGSIMFANTKTCGGFAFCKSVGEYDWFRGVRSFRRRAFRLPGWCLSTRPTVSSYLCVRLNRKLFRDSPAMEFPPRRGKRSPCEVISQRNRSRWGSRTISTGGHRAKETQGWQDRSDRPQPAFPLAPAPSSEISCNPPAMWARVVLAR